MLSLSVSDHVRFKTRRGSTVTALPIAVELGKFLRAERAVRAVEWKRLTAACMEPEQNMNPSDLLHAIVALYSTSLPDQTLQNLYRKICEEGCKTLFLLRDTSEILSDWESRTPSSLSAQSRENSDLEINNNPLPNTVEKETHGRLSDTEKQDLKDHEGNTSSPLTEEWHRWSARDRQNNYSYSSIQELFERKSGMVRAPSLSDGGRSENDIHGGSPFSDVFSDISDTSDSASDMDEEEDPDDMNRSIEAFLRAVAARKRNKHFAQETYSLLSSNVGIEHRLLASATFHKNYRLPGTKVVHISLMAVRKRYRKCGIGKYMLKRLKNPSQVGPYDALVVSADTNSLPFFIKSGFTDDLILSSRFRELEDKWDGCTLLCYLPPFDGHYPPLPGVSEWNRPEAVDAMDDEIDRWRQKSLEAYQAQVTCLTRLQQEVLRLHKALRQQDSIIHYMKVENQKLQARLGKAERKTAQALIPALEKETEEFERLFALGLSETDVS